MTAPPLSLPPKDAASSIANEPFDPTSLNLIHNMHSGLGVFHPNGLVSSDTIIMAAYSSVQRNYIQRLLHSNLILVSLDG